MTAPDVSVVIVSHGRPDHLPLCLESLRSQTHPSFEVIVVADLLPQEFEGLVRFIPFNDENISAARNLGIANSAADFIAFCDDDAIPDPPWLERLMAPFENPDVGSVGGFTRGRNGISRQWGAMRFDREGYDHPFEIDETPSFLLFPSDKDTPIKLIGANMGFRKKALLAVGGFDEAFHFFLEDADIKLRLDDAGWQCALVPLAQVHHSFAASRRRTTKRVPTDLFEIGASKAYFCKKHSTSRANVVENFRTEQQQRVARLKPSTRAYLMGTLDAGLDDGAHRVPVSIGNITNTVFHRFQTHTGPHTLLCAGFQSNRWSRKTASALIEKGHRVSVVRLMPSTLYFQVSFIDGYWLHKGGVWGKSYRAHPLVQFTSRKRRFIAERERIQKIYQIDEVLYG